MLPDKKETLGTSFFSLNSTQALRDCPEAYSLFAILRQAGRDCEKELCIDDPVSIDAKAQDLSRNLPHWLNNFQHVAYLKPDSFVFKIFAEIVEVLNEVCELLEPHTASRIRKHHDAASCLVRLKSSLMSVLERLIECFQDPE